MVASDSYWKRRKVEPCENGGIAYRELHMRIPVGTFVKVFDRLPTVPAIIEYGLVEPGKYDTWDSVDKRLFTIYFERVTEEEELGLIALAEQD